MDEYLTAASEAVGPDEAGEGRYRGWKDKLLVGAAKEVIARPAGLHGKKPEKEEVETCLCYLGNRADHLDYARALDQGLPVGSGEVESWHRSVLQKRLEKTGAWWTKPNAETMAQLKTLQANGDREKLGQKIAALKTPEKSHPFHISR